jgi:actin cytoskeleton-regulatory complex protein PAN1
LQYTEVDEDRKNIELSLNAVEKILSRINENIREQEGRLRLKTISQDLWIGQG